MHHAVLCNQLSHAPWAPLIVTLAPRATQGPVLPLKLSPLLHGRQRQSCPPQAFLALDAFLAPPPILLQSPPEIAMAVFVSPLVSAPQCLCTLDYADLVAPAPPLADGQVVHHGVQRVLAAREDSIKLETAVCLLNPVVMEENAAEILRDAAEEEALSQQMQLRMRYASELHLGRQSSLVHDTKGQRKAKR
jgi:hypothetical protein